MAEPIVPPNQQAAFVDDVKKPTAEWYRALKLLFDRFNASVSSADSGIASKATKEQAWADYSLIEFPEDKSYRIVVNSPFAWTITSVTTIASAGSCTVTIEINGTPLGGSANTADTSEETQAHSSANAVAAGADIEIVVSSNSGCEGLSVTLGGTRTLA